MSNPENKERPNASEKAPSRDPQATVRALGRTAIRGAGGR
jgi:hypothetical protein